MPQPGEHFAEIAVALFELARLEAWNVEGCEHLVICRGHGKRASRLSRHGRHAGAAAAAGRADRGGALFFLRRWSILNLRSRR
jgi:hypothetical protein